MSAYYRAKRLLGPYKGHIAGSYLHNTGQKALKGAKKPAGRKRKNTMKVKGVKRLKLSKKKVSKMKPDELHSGTFVETLKIRLKGHKRKGFPKGQKYISTYISGGFLQGNSGFQSGVNMIGVGTVAQCITSTGVSADGYHSDINYFDLNPNEYNTGGILYTGGVVPKMDNIVISHVQQEFLFTNLTNMEQEMDLYFCVAKKNHALDPLQAFATGLANELVAPVIAAVPPTPAYAAPPTFGGINSNTPFSNPREVKLFNQLWKVLKVKAFHMSGGATAKLNVSISMERNYSKEEIVQFAAGGSIFMANHSVVCFGLVRGQMAVDKTGATRHVTTAACDIGYIVNQRTHIHPQNVNTRRFLTSTVLDQIVANVTNANESVINVVDTEQAEVDAQT